MPNGRPYESPLNKLADALPNFILQMQDIKMRQETQEALASHRTAILAATIERNEVVAAVREERQRLGAIDRVRGISEDMLKLESQGKGWAASKYGRELVAQYYPEGIPTKRVVEKVTETHKFQVKKLEGSIDKLLESKRLAGQPRLDSAGLQTGLYPLFSEEKETELQDQISELGGLGVEYPSTFLDEPAIVVDEVTPELGEKPKPRVFESRDEYQARLIEAGFGEESVTMPAEDPLELFK